MIPLKVGDRVRCIAGEDVWDDVVGQCGVVREVNIGFNSIPYIQVKFDNLPTRIGIYPHLVELLPI